MLAFAVPDAEADTRISVAFGRDTDQIARVRVVARATGGAHELNLSDIDTLDACVADGTITPAERTALVGAGGIIRRLAMRARARMGVAP